MDDNGNFKLEKSEEPLEGDLVDNVKLDDQLIQTVTVRMSLKTRRKILQLDHKNILKVNKIKTDSYKTILVSDAFDGHVCALSGTNQDISVDQLFSYFKQMTLGLQELHKHNIVHCDLRCSHIYVNPDEGTLKIGHVGRAVSLNGTSLYALKMMPVDAKKWSAPEVRNKGKYSEASDIFNLAAVFWEAISLHINTIYQNQPLETFKNCSAHLEKYYQSVNLRNANEDPINKLVNCILKCWNPNPTKRPTLDVILDTIEEKTSHNDQCCSTAGDTSGAFDGYERVIDLPSTDFSINYVWRSVVNEFEVSQGLPHNTRPFIELKEKSPYDGVCVQLRNKTQSKRGIIL